MGRPVPIDVWPYVYDRKLWKYMMSYLYTAHRESQRLMSEVFGPLQNPVTMVIAGGHQLYTSALELPYE
jgi:hypothetical protein